MLSANRASPRLKAQLILAHNITALLRARHASKRGLAFFCGHEPPWLSKVLTGERGVQSEDLDKIADFFGLTVADLFTYGISPKLERRKAERRSPLDRRANQDRRQPSNVQRLYGDLPKKW